jgi:hypothetical protein
MDGLGGWRMAARPGVLLAEKSVSRPLQLGIFDSYLQCLPGLECDAEPFF